MNEPNYLDPRHDRRTRPHLRKLLDNQAAEIARLREEIETITLSSNERIAELMGQIQNLRGQLLP